MTYLYPVIFEASNRSDILYVAFTSQAAQDFIADAQREYDKSEEAKILGTCELPMYVDEIALVDNYGFPCERHEAAIVVPWLGEIN